MGTKLLTGGPLDAIGILRTPGVAATGLMASCGLAAGATDEALEAADVLGRGES